MRRIPLFLCIPPMLAACADLPDVETTISPVSQTAQFPDLVPLGPLLATLPPPEDAPETRQTRRAQTNNVTRPIDLDTRTEQLQNRAQALREAPI